MKLGNIILIIFTSILTFIGLLFTKLYEKYVKRNIAVQAALYVFWTAIIFRVMWWAIKPIVCSLHIISIITTMKSIVSTTTDFISEPLVLLLLLVTISVSLLIGASTILRRL